MLNGIFLDIDNRIIKLGYRIDLISLFIIIVKFKKSIFVNSLKHFLNANDLICKQSHLKPSYPID
jgi:hypothetical protein